MSTLLTATLLLFLLWPAYAFLLRVSDRYGLNRFLLLLVMVAVCALPFVSLPSPAPVATQSVRGTVSYLEESVRPSVAFVPKDQAVYRSDAKGEMVEEVPVEATSVDVLPLVYGIGLGIMLLVLGIRLLFILTLHLRSRLNKDGTFRLLHPGATPGQAFTFGRNLYFSEDVPQDADFRHILDHECVHARQGHTLDILLSELFLCVFWFHPAAWWLRTKMRANLEYLVDRAVVSGGADRRDYQLALVRQSQGAYGLALALPFSEPTLKSRIARMTGLPEYRVVALLAAVALVFWLGVTLFVVNGAVFDDESATITEYLEAAAFPGDPYYDYYQGLLPEELNSLEIYTNRMVTIDEYLQLRAILGKVPGAKLFVYKNRFDEGYSLELSYGDRKPAVSELLNPEPTVKYISILGVETDGGAGQYAPVSATWRKDVESPNGSLKGFFFNSDDSFSLDAFVFRDDILKQGEFGDDVVVYVNREKVDLLKQPKAGILINSDNDRASVKLNGVEISEFGADDWLKLAVEGRPLRRANVRMAQLLKLPGGGAGSSYVTEWQEKGTYREWYDNIDEDKKADNLITRYNDRPASLGFLLDTEFGDKAIIQIGTGENGRHVVQVIDDLNQYGGLVPYIAPYKAKKRYAPKEIKKVDLYFRRLPTMVELMAMQHYVDSFEDIDLRLFQDCKSGAGNYTLYLGNQSGTIAATFKLAEDKTYKDPLHFELRHDKQGEPTIKVYQSTPDRMSPAAKTIEVYTRVNGKSLITTPKDFNLDPFLDTMFDDVPDAMAIQCKLPDLELSSASDLITPVMFWSNPERIFFANNSSYNEGLLKGLHLGLEKAGFGNRIRIYYINDQLVSEEAFGQYEGGEYAYVRMGTWSNIDDAPVILEIVD